MLLLRGRSASHPAAAVLHFKGALTLTGREVQLQEGTRGGKGGGGKGGGEAPHRAVVRRRFAVAIAVSLLCAATTAAWTSKVPQRDSTLDLLRHLVAGACLRPSKHSR